MRLHPPDATEMSRRQVWIPTWAGWCLFSLFCLVWFYTLGARTLVPTDEGRYAEIAREMAISGDVITLRLNGIRYFGKPPLQAWMNALTFSVFGLGEWQARLWTGLCGMAGILMVFLAGRRVYNAQSGFTAALVLGSSFFWAGAAHINSYDMGVSAMMTLALCAMLIAQRADAAPRAQRNWMLVCWAVLAAAGFFAGQVLMLGHEPFGREKAGVGHLAALRADITPRTPIYGVAMYEYALPFYLGRTLIMVGRAEDGMRLGLQKEPSLWIPTLDRFISVWAADRARGKNAVAFMRPEMYVSLRERGGPMRVIGRDPRRVIVTNDVPVQPPHARLSPLT